MNIGIPKNGGFNGLAIMLRPAPMKMLLWLVIWGSSLVKNLCFARRRDYILIYNLVPDLLSVIDAAPDADTSEINADFQHFSSMHQ